MHQRTRKHRRARRWAAAAVVPVVAAGLTAAALNSPAHSEEPIPSAEPVPQAAESADHVPANDREIERGRDRAEAVTALVHGEAEIETKGDSKVVDTAGAKATELSRTTDKVFVLPVEFGDTIDPAYGGLAGPAHNELPEPDRDYNSYVYWTEDFSPDYYEDTVFGGGESLRSYYEGQSSGAYTIEGQVEEWVRVDYSISHYGTDACKKDGASISTYYCNEQLTVDALNAWYERELAAGAAQSELDALLAEYDQADTYDWDADGNYDEADGYIDSIVIVFAGESQTTGGGVNGTNAIGSHKGYVSYLRGTNGVTGPENGNLYGGEEIGDSGVWVNDYLMFNENAGLGTIAHEFGHGLGLPDLYDTSGGENSTAYWSVMSNGSFLGDATAASIHPADLGAWAKLQLGWLDYTTVEAGEIRAVTLNPVALASQTDGKEAVVVNLPADADGNARYYVVENRQYVGQDAYLNGGIPNLGWYNDATYKWKTEMLSYETGVMIWYWNTAYSDNKTKTNGGYGEILPIDAHAEPALDSTGAVIRNRLQSYDAPFGLGDTEGLTFHSSGAEQSIASFEGIAVFDDLAGPWHYDPNPYGSSYTAEAGVTVTVSEEHADGRVTVLTGISD